jgi:molybdopterin-containing oxidoreductase family iron-sulfur binding subunit
VANGMGFNAYALRTTASLWTAPSAEITVQPGRYALATTQFHQVIDAGTNENRELVRHGTSADAIFEHVVQRLPAAEQAAARKEFEDQKDARRRVELPVIPDLEMRTERGLPRSLYPGQPDQGTQDGSHNPAYPAWAMVIDLSACIGCNACVVACQSENNIPVVGKDQVLAQRNMHWIRIDTYFETEDADPASINDPETHFQPVPCMHCEKAPCEVVCPVAATSHSVEGLNEMTYNRCVGTRYCSNNCPYKVRRFNFLQYSDTETPVLKLMRNPDVSVRNRGVMEKCSYCVQRLSHARIESKKLTAQATEAPTPQDAARLKAAAHEAITSVVSACAQACPTQAIVFGNINPADNPRGGESQVYQLKRMPTNYGLLHEELQTRPRTTYLAKIDNPHPALAAAEGGHGAGERKAAEHAGGPAAG